MWKYFIIVLMLLNFPMFAESVQSASVGDVKKRLVKVERIFRGHTVKAMRIAGRISRAKCAVFTVYRVYESIRFVCSDWRLGGKCLIPGYRKAVGTSNCPRICNRPGWRTEGTRREFAGQMLRDCTPIGYLR